MISAVIITLNEERNIARCIESLKDVVDEIVVIDSFSTDNTSKICQDLGVVFIQTKWMGYSETKNFGNNQAKGDYILSIDADEALSDDLKRSLLRVKDTLNGRVYAFNRLTNYCGSWVKHCGWYPDRKVRLFPKGTVYWQGEFVHEELVIPNLEECVISGDLWHYSYYNQLEHKLRADKYSLLTAQKLKASGKSCGPLKPYLSALAKFFSIYFIKAGVLDGKAGWYIAKISAQSNIVKYKELIRLNSNG